MLEKEVEKIPLSQQLPYHIVNRGDPLSQIAQILWGWRYHVPLCILNPNLPQKAVKTIEHRLIAAPPIEADTLLLTSGTTNLKQDGYGKIVLLSLENHLASAQGSHPKWTLSPSDRYTLSLPLFHISGLMILVRTLLAGATLILPHKKNLLHNRPTHLSLVTTQLLALLEEIEKTAPPLKGVLLGGGPIPYSLCQKAALLGIPLFLTYGMSEMSSQITTQLFDPQKPLSFGHPLPGREMQIDELGQILVKGKTLFTGYLGETIKEDWFATKDLGNYSPETGLIIKGRLDRMFISGGENIHPEEIESILLGHPFIKEAALTPTPDAKWGMVGKAHIKVIAPITSEEIKKFLLNHLPPHKIPKKIFIQ